MGERFEAGYRPEAPEPNERESKLTSMQETARMIAISLRERFPDRYRNDADIAKAWSEFSKRLLNHTFGDHSQSLLWLTAELFDQLDHQKQLALASHFNLDDPQTTLKKLSAEKIAEGLTVAEVAGDEYAKLVAQLGGRSASWRGKTFTQFDVGSQPVIRRVDSVCTPETAAHYFKPKSYDLFLAVGYGNVAPVDFHAISSSLLKRDKQDHYWITKDQFGSIEPLIKRDI